MNGVKHADLIRAALDGKKIQFRKKAEPAGQVYAWKTFADARVAVANMAAEYPSQEYRLEPPPPPPDVVKYSNVFNSHARAGEHWFGALFSTKEQALEQRGRAYGSACGMYKTTFDDATGMVKSVELVKE